MLGVCLCVVFLRDRCGDMFSPSPVQSCFLHDMSQPESHECVYVCSREKLRVSLNLCCPSPAVTGSFLFFLKSKIV